MPLERRQIALGAAAAVMFGLAIWTWWPAASAPAPAATTAARARGGRPTAVVETGPVGPVKLASLQSSRNGPGEGARNPFRFQPKVAPAPPPPIRTVPEPTEAPVRTGPIGPPPAPPIALKLIGVVERASGVKWAVLSDGKSAPMFGKDGDIIDGRYLIVKIGAESIEMTHADGRGRQVIRLTGQ